MDPNQDKAEDRWIALAYAWLGVPPMLIGGVILLVCYAFASMVNPSLEGWERTKEILLKMFPGAIPGVFLAFVGAAFFFELYRLRGLWARLLSPYTEEMPRVSGARSSEST